MKRIGYLLLGVILLSALPLFFGKTWLKNRMAREWEAKTGLHTVIEDVEVNILRRTLIMRNVVLSNPPDFSYPEWMTIRKVYIRYDWITLFGNNPHFDEVRMEIPRMYLIRRDDGDLNIERIVRKSETSASGGQSSTPPLTDGASPPADAAHAPERTSKIAGYSIDQLRITLDEVEVRRYTKDQSEPVIMPLPVGLDRTFSKVTNLRLVTTQLADDLILRAGLNLVANLDATLQDAVDEDGNLNAEGLKQFKELKKLFWP